LGIEDQDFVGACGGNAAFLSPSYNRSTTEDENYAATAAAVTPDTTRRIMIKAASKSLPGDSFDRKSKFTAPRSLVLNTKYDGAVTTTIWTGFAMLLVRKNGDRRVVQGPGTFMLEYDESPQVITLSTGKPKTTDNSFRTVFLQTNANLVSDIVDVETRDLVPCQLKLSYRVNFEGEPLQWFNVDNYVKYLTDHMRSRLRCEIKKMSVEEFYGNSADTIRDIVLGRKTVTADGKVHARPGAEFKENGMHVYDVEVLQVRMVDANVEKLLSSAQRESIQNNVSLQSEQRRLTYTQESERLKRMIEAERTMTQQETMRLATENATLKAQLDLKVIEAAAIAETRRLETEMNAKTARLEIKQAEVNYDHSNKEALILLEKKEQDVRLEGLKAESQSVIDKLTAITPDLVSALQAFGDKAMVERVAKSMAPFTLLGGNSAVDVIRKALAGTKFADVLGAAKSLKK
jgi:major vault protein